MLLMESILYSTKNLKGIQNIDKYAFKNKRQTVFPHQIFKSKKVIFKYVTSFFAQVFRLSITFVYHMQYILPSTYCWCTSISLRIFKLNYSIIFWLYISIYCNLYSLEFELKYDKSLIPYVTAHCYILLLISISIMIFL